MYYFEVPSIRSPICQIRAFRAFWPNGVTWSATLDRVEEITLGQGGKHFVLRPQAPGCAGSVFQAVGVALSPLLRQLPSATPPPEPVVRFTAGAIRSETKGAAETAPSATLRQRWSTARRGRRRSLWRPTHWSFFCVDWGLLTCRFSASGADGRNNGRCESFGRARC
jgi:hypothetical protein